MVDDDMTIYLSIVDVGTVSWRGKEARGVQKLWIQQDKSRVQPDKVAGMI